METHHPREPQDAHSDPARGPEWRAHGAGSCGFLAGGLLSTVTYGVIGLLIASNLLRNALARDAMAWFDAGRRRVELTGADREAAWSPREAACSRPPMARPAT